MHEIIKWTAAVTQLTKLLGQVLSSYIQMIFWEGKKVSPAFCSTKPVRQNQRLSFVLHKV